MAEKSLYKILKGILSRVIPISLGGTGATNVDDAVANLGFGNKILWQGGSYMSASQTAVLSEPISKQKNGIVLVWCNYENNAIANNSFNCFFIPKLLVQLQPGKSHGMFLQSWRNGPVAYKFVYVNNDGIVGHDNNMRSAETLQDITYTTNRFVLRYVIGV